LFDVLNVLPVCFAVLHIIKITVGIFGNLHQFLPLQTDIPLFQQTENSLYFFKGISLTFYMPGPFLIYFPCGAVRKIMNLCPECTGDKMRQNPVPFFGHFFKNPAESAAGNKTKNQSVLLTLFRYILLQLADAILPFPCL